VEGNAAITLLPKVSPTARKVLAVLCWHAHKRTGRCDPSYDVIAEELAMPRRNVMRAIAELEAASLLRVERRRVAKDRNTSNAYHPNWDRLLRVFDGFEANVAALAHIRRASRAASQGGGVSSATRVVSELTPKPVEENPWIPTRKVRVDSESV
jgi:hypothetical protein